MSKNILVLGFGCSMNLNDTEKIQGFVESHGFKLVNDVKQANVIVVNTCAVKEQTETKMLNLIEKLKTENPNARMIVSGCLPKMSLSVLEKRFPGIESTGPELIELSKKLELPETDFFSNINEKRLNELVSIITISKGCLSNCTFCGVKQARGALKSQSVDKIFSKFSKDLNTTKEFWITAQDTGCYGLDINTNLPELLEKLLTKEENFRLRIGMMSPQWFDKFFDSLVEFFNDERIYSFLHLPVQAGSNKILKSMNRQYTAEKWLSLIEEFRKKVPNSTIATDIIVGFPGETDDDFNETVELLKKAKLDLVNISRFGARPNTVAEKMKNQLHGKVKKERSRILTKLCAKYTEEKNKVLENTIQEILVTKGESGNFMGRTNSYKPVIIKENKLNEFCKVKIIKSHKTYLGGILVN